MFAHRTTPRKAAFKAALAYAGMTKTEWCAQRAPTPITAQHLNFVLAGVRKSPALEAEVDAFIAKHTPRAAARVA